MGADRFTAEYFIADAVQDIANRLHSPNEQDSNGETANIVDGLFAIARAIESLAKAIKEKEA